MQILDNPSLDVVSGLEHLSAIGGGLTLDGTGLPSMPCMDELAYVGGDVVIASNPALAMWTPAGASQRIVVGGNVLLQSNRSFGPAQYPDRLPLWIIGGALTVADDGFAGLLRLPELESVSGITLSNNSALVDIDVPALASIGGDFVLLDNAALSPSHGINHVRAVGGRIWVERNAALASLGTLVDVTRVGGDVLVVDNPRLEALWMNGLTSAAGILIARNSALTALGTFGSDANVSGLANVQWLQIDANPALAHLALPSLTFASSLAITNNPALPACDALTLAGHVTAPTDRVTVISGNAGEGTGCP